MRSTKVVPKRSTQVASNWKSIKLAPNLKSTKVAPNGGLSERLSITQMPNGLPLSKWRYCVSLEQGAVLAEKKDN